MVLLACFVSLVEGPCFKHLPSYRLGSFLVYPTAMLYPQNLIYVNLFDVLHRSKGELLQGKRYFFFFMLYMSYSNVLKFV